ncbi:MAG TPA: hypothetical protein VHE36_10360 [Sphingomicrobium sp.]|jgi:hypothetical protein|nr:hypothetical protein [Sphingomicrobium sp.]
MKSALVRALALAALITLVGCETSGTISEIDKKFYKGCGTNPPEDPTCGHF